MIFNNNQSNNLEQWRSMLASPDRQWKQGFSAYELAHEWGKQSTGEFPESVSIVLDSANSSIVKHAKPAYLFPEYKVYLDTKKAPSQNDLYILAKSNREDIVIMVEGKVEEPFGEIVGKWLTDKITRRNRLDFLCKTIGLNNIPDHIHYQLLHRTASVIIEANRIDAKYGMMMVHSFSEHHSGFKEYEDFLSLYGLKAEKNNVVGPVTINEINLFFTWIVDNKSTPSLTKPPIFSRSNVIHQAIQVATIAHKSQSRKGTKIPYITHPYSVAMILAQEGYNDELIAAGILHDTLEDTDITISDIELKFGKGIANIVEGCSEPNKALPWKERKTHTLKYLETASDDIRIVTCADKLHNIRSMSEDHQTLGDSLWSKFNQGRDQQGWYYRGLVKSLRKGKTFRLVQEIHQEVDRLFGNNE